MEACHTYRHYWEHHSCPMHLERGAVCQLKQTVGSHTLPLPGSVFKRNVFHQGWTGILIICALVEGDEAAGCQGFM